MENTDYKAAIKACMEIESGDDVLDFYENHGTAIFRALRFAEKMMDCPSPQMLLEMMKILDGKKMHDAFDCIIAQALKELGE